MADAVRLRRLSVLLSDEEWAAIQRIPRNRRAGVVGVAIGAAYELGQFNNEEARNK